MQDSNTYYDEYQYSDYMHDEYKKLRRVPSDQRARQFIDYCKKAIAGYESGRVPLRDAAYAIAGTTFIHEISHDPELEDITLVASELELPPEVHKLDTQKEWQELLQMIAAAETRLSTDSENRNLSRTARPTLSEHEIGANAMSTSTCQARRKEGQGQASVGKQVRPIADRHRGSIYDCPSSTPGRMGGKASGPSRKEERPVFSRVC